MLRSLVRGGAVFLLASIVGCSSESDGSVSSSTTGAAAGATTTAGGMGGAHGGEAGGGAMTGASGGGGAMGNGGATGDGGAMASGGDGSGGAGGGGGEGGGDPDACAVDGNPGDCMDVSACAALGDHSSTPGYCPGPTNIECCTLTPNTADNPPTPAGYEPMMQSEVTPDMTTWAVAILNDPTDYPMFATTTMVFGTLTVLARVEWHPPDFQNSVVHRGVTLYQPI